MTWSFDDIQSLPERVRDRIFGAEDTRERWDRLPKEQRGARVARTLEEELMISNIFFLKKPLEERENEFEPRAVYPYSST